MFTLTWTTALVMITPVYVDCLYIAMAMMSQILIQTWKCNIDVWSYCIESVEQTPDFLIFVEKIILVKDSFCQICTV